jgi:TolB protein
MKRVSIIAFTFASGLAITISAPAYAHKIVRLTTNPACDQAPAWSPDGKTIAFHSNRSGTWHIYTVPATGGTVKQLTAWSGLQGQPAYSPDGNKIAFVFMPPGGRQWIDEEIGIMPARGGSYINFTKTKGLDWWPDWSPDGRKIVFSSTRNVISPWHVTFNYVQPYPTGSAKRLSSWPYPLDEQHPRWSPNGSEIAYNADTKMSTWAIDIFRIPATGGKPINLTNTPNVIDFAPTWSPDGRYIVYDTGALQGNTDLFMIPRAGGTPIRLTDHPDHDYGAAWSPVGNKIAFTSQRYNKRGDICLLYLEFPSVQPTSIGKIKALYR